MSNSKMINIKPKELQEKQFAKYKNYKKQNKQIKNKLKAKPKRIQWMKREGKKQQQNNWNPCICKLINKNAS